jgi:hypothetical protein
MTDARVFVWVFNGEGARFASGVFTLRENAVAWILLHRLTGILTRYPVDTGVYDWAIQTGCFRPKRAEQQAPVFIGTFTCAALEHAHFENGVVVS